MFQPCKDEGLLSSPTLYRGVSVSTIAVVARVIAECNQPHPLKNVSIYLYNFRGVGEYLLNNPDNNICEYLECFPDKNYSSFYT